MFDPKLDIGQVIQNTDVVNIFKCGNMGGMRRSKTTGTLVLISDYTKGLYHDKWIGGVLHYTGMGKSGDQDIHWAQNATLADCKSNGVDVHLFEVIDPGEYIYCGRIELVDKPYVEKQLGEDGTDRKVWMFPIRPVPNNNVKKPAMFVFADMEDYRVRGGNAEKEYKKFLDAKKKGNVKPISSSVSATPKSAPVVIPADILGKKVIHKSFGTGTVIASGSGVITIKFDQVGEKKLEYETCIKNNLVKFV